MSALQINNASTLEGELNHAIGALTKLQSHLFRDLGALVSVGQDPALIQVLVGEVGALIENLEGLRLKIQHNYNKLAPQASLD